MRELLPRVGGTLFARLFSAAGSVALVWIMSKAWAPAQVADYAIVFGYLAMLQMLPLLGLNLALTRDVAAEPRAAGRGVPAALAIAMVTSLALALLLGLAGEMLYEGQLRWAFWAAALALPPTGFVCVVEALLMGTGRLVLLATVNAAETILRLEAFVLVGLGAESIVDFLLLIAAARVSIAAAYLTDPVVRSALHGRPAWREVAIYLRQAPWFLAAVAVGALAARLDIILLSGMIGRDALGIYAVSVRLYEMALIVPITLTSVLFPLLARTQAADRTAFRLLARHTLWLVALAGLLAACGAALVVGPIMHAMFAPPYSSASDTLRILLFAAAVVGVGQVLASMLIVSGRQLDDVAAQVIGLCVTALGLLLLVPWLGVQGAAIAVLTGLASQVVVRLQMCRPMLRMESHATERLALPLGSR